MATSGARLIAKPSTDAGAAEMTDEGATLPPGPYTLVTYCAGIGIVKITVTIGSVEFSQIVTCGAPPEPSQLFIKNAQNGLAYLVHVAAQADETVALSYQLQAN